MLEFCERIHLGNGFMRIVITGAKGAGKSSIGQLLASKLGLPFVETDLLIEDIYETSVGERLSYREIHRIQGEEAFRQLEHEAVKEAARRDWVVIITGGSTMLHPLSRRLLREDGILVFLKAPSEILEERAKRAGSLRGFLSRGGHERFEDYAALRTESLWPFADVVLDVTEGSVEELTERLTESIVAEISTRAKSANTFGDLIRVTSFGESHGVAVGAVLDGVSPGIDISVEKIQKELDRRRPGQSAVTTQRKESDEIHILSGVFEGKTTGHPIALVIYNKDQDSSRYEEIKALFRPGHADFTYYTKYGIRDHRGGGRSSARETAARVACGAVAKQILAERGVEIIAHSIEIAGIRAESKNFEHIEYNNVRCADELAAKLMEEAILTAKREQDSVGGVVQLEILGVPSGLGDPIFAKLDARLTMAMMSIPASTAVSVGDGFLQARMRGSESNDGMRGGQFLSNHAGGILGGISTGMPIIMKIAFKPTSSIARKQPTMDTAGNDREIQVIGRHDPCIVPRAVPVVENMAALVILDAWEIQKRIRWDG